MSEYENYVGEVWNDGSSIYAVINQINDCILVMRKSPNCYIAYITGKCPVFSPFPAAQRISWNWGRYFDSLAYDKSIDRAFAAAMDDLKRRASPPDYWEDQLTLGAGEKHYAEACFCRVFHKSLLDFDCWTHLQDILDIAISYDEYSFVSQSFSGDVLDLEQADVDWINCILELRRDMSVRLADNLCQYREAIDKRKESSV